MRYIFAEPMSMERRRRLKPWKRTVLLKKFVTSIPFFLWGGGEFSVNMCFFICFFCFSVWMDMILRFHALHKEVYDWFDISFDKFGRTSTPEQTEVCQAIFKKLWKNNWLTEKPMQQVRRLFFSKDFILAFAIVCK